MEPYFDFPISTASEVLVIREAIKNLDHVTVEGNQISGWVLRGPTMQAGAVTRRLDLLPANYSYLKTQFDRFCNE